MQPAARATLEQGLESLGLTLTPAKLERLIAFHDLLMRRNLELNLTGHDDETESVTKNLLNSLAPWRHIEIAAPTCDIGTGAGFPGLPLAIALDMPQLSLVESKAKKCRFLEEAVAGLTGVNVANSDANELRGPFTQALASGFGTLAKFAQVTQRAMPKNSRLLAWKGKREVIDAELAELGGKTDSRGIFLTRGIEWQIIPFAVPHLDAERHLCIGTRR
jgi:16S rRNA (guanine527-N7)-methyltransferase